MDGKIVIGTGVDTKGLERDLLKLQKELEKYAKEEEKLTNKKLLLEIDTERALDDLQTMDDKVEILQKKLENIDARKSSIVSWKQNESNPEWIKLNEEYDRTKAKIDEITRKEEELVNARERQLHEIDEINQKLAENTINQEKTNEKIDEANEKLNKAKNSIDLGPLFNKMNSSLEKVGKKVAHIGLSMLGIRSLYGMISSSVSRVSQNNAEIKAGIDAINNVLDNIIGRLLQALLPVINIIVKGISYIGEKLFGIDLSSNQFSNNMKNANKSASKLRKQLMGFDEMNILNEDGTIGALGGAGGNNGGNKKDYGIYNDMSDFNKDLADLGVVAVYTGKDLKETRLQLEQLIADVKLGNATMTEKNGIVTIMDKAGNSIQFTKQEYEKLLDDINHSRVTSRNLDIWWRVRDTFTNWNLNVMLKYHKKIEKLAKGDFSDWNKEIENAKTNFVKNMDGATYSFKNGMYEIKMTNGEIVRLTKDEWEQLQPYMKYLGLNIVNNVNDTGGKIQLKSTETKNKIISDSNEAKNNITSNTSSISDAIANDIQRAKTNFEKNMQGATYTYKNGMYEIKMANGETTRLNQEQWKLYQAYLKANNIQIVEDNKSTNKELQKNSKDGVKTIEDEYDKLPKWMKNNVFIELAREFGVLGKDTGENFGNALKKVVNKIIDKVEKTINDVLATAYNMLPLKIGPKPRVNLQSFKLAKGGIINKVGSGVPVGYATAGERGREAVLPLTDTQQMAYLGREIAKNVVIQLTNITELDGRTIARTTAQVMSDMSFASNGGVI